MTATWPGFTPPLTLRQLGLSSLYWLPDYLNSWFQLTHHLQLKNSSTPATHPQIVSFTSAVALLLASSVYFQEMCYVSFMFMTYSCVLAPCHTTNLHLLPCCLVPAMLCPPATHTLLQPAPCSTSACPVIKNLTPFTRNSTPDSLPMCQYPLLGQPDTKNKTDRYVSYDRDHGTWWQLIMDYE